MPSEYKSLTLLPSFNHGFSKPSIALLPVSGILILVAGDDVMLAQAAPMTS